MKKLFALALVMIMVIGMLPSMAFACGTSCDSSCPNYPNCESSSDCTKPSKPSCDKDNCDKTDCDVHHPSCDKNPCDKPDCEVHHPSKPTPDPKPTPDKDCCNGGSGNVCDKGHEDCDCVGECKCITWEDYKDWWKGVGDKIKDTIKDVNDFVKENIKTPVCPAPSEPCCPNCGKTECNGCTNNTCPGYTDPNKSPSTGVEMGSVIFASVMMISAACAAAYVFATKREEVR